MTRQPDSEPPSADLIERLQRRRTRVLFTQAFFFLLWQVTYFSATDHTPPRLVDHVRVGAYVVWSIVLLAVIGAGGGAFLPRAVRAVLNDETTVAHRWRGMAMGFWAAMGAALGCYVVTFFDTVTTTQVIHAVLTAGVGGAILTYAILERRAQPHD